MRPNPATGTTTIHDPSRGTRPGPVVLGTGRLRDAIARYLDRLAFSLSDDETEPLPTLVVADTPQEFDRLLGEVRDLPGAWLPVHGEIDRIVLGPLVRPGRSGCPRCVARRRSGPAHDLPGNSQLRRGHGARIDTTCSPLLGGLAAETAAALAAQEVVAWGGRRPIRTDAAVVMVKLTALAVTIHRFLPDPLCPDCGVLPDDAPLTARLTPVRQPTTAPGSGRIRRLPEMAADLEATYLDAEIGIVSAVRTLTSFSLPVALARVQPAATTDGATGYGRSTDFEASQLTAMTEALERMGGLRPGGRRTTVRGTFRSVRDSAIDPRSLGLYSEQRYAIEGFPFRRYHEDLELAWVWAYSFTRDAPVLVPESYTYYDLPGHAHNASGDRPFVYEISNGCALGSCVEEAIVHGLLEIAERDAFLLTWFARLPVPRLDLSTAQDVRIPLVLERVRTRTGYEVHLFDTTIDHRIPSVWAMAVDERPSPDRPRAMCAAGSALEPDRGVLNALYELVAMIDSRLASYPDERGRAEAMIADPSLVRHMEDHALLYCHPGAFDRLGYLLDSSASRTLPEIRRDHGWPPTTDITDDLAEIVGRFAQAGLDVIVVDQTTPDHRATGLSCVKVIVPGTLPMTFGYYARRVDGLPRLLELPHRLGYRDGPLSPDDVNPHPHPFP